LYAGITTERDADMPHRQYNASVQSVDKETSYGIFWQWKSPAN
jgi:hypothetical protein